MKSLGLFFSTVMISLSAGATEGLFTNIHHHYQSPRALGMGDAFVAVANDYSALFYNPAGLARLSEGQINLSIDVGASFAFSEFYQDIDDISKMTGTDDERTNAYIALLQKKYGEHFALRMGFPQAFWVRPNWGVAVIPADFTLEMSVHNQAVPSLSARTYLDTTVAYGYGDRVKNDNLGGHTFWGVTGKFVNRGYFSRDMNVLDLVADSNFVRSQDLHEGYTVDADVGLLWQPFLPTEGFFSLLSLVRPTFGAVVHNVVQTGFTRKFGVLNKDSGSAPEKLYRVLDVGTRWEYPSFWIFSGRGVMDFRDIGHPNMSLKKGFHLGFEFDWSVTSWWKGQYRIGINQGYPTLGASALFTVFNLDLVTYGEDIGTYNNPRENRVYMLKTNIDL